MIEATAASMVMTGSLWQNIEVRGAVAVLVCGLAAACGGNDSVELEALREEVAALKTTMTAVPETTAAPTTTTAAPTTTTAAPTTTTAVRIAFISDRYGDDEIFVMNADGSEVSQLTDNDDEDSVPVWSPDGERIAFNSDRYGDDEIFVMNADGSGGYSTGQRGILPRWSN